HRCDRGAQPPSNQRHRAGPVPHVRPAERGRPRPRRRGADQGPGPRQDGQRANPDWIDAMFANCQMGGQDMGFPDVCLTPTPPIVTPMPYPNIAMGPTAVGAVYNILMTAMPAHNMGTTIPMTNGDN